MALGRDGVSFSASEQGFCSTVWEILFIQGSGEQARQRRRKNEGSKKEKDGKQVRQTGVSEHTEASLLFYNRKQERRKQPPRKENVRWSLSLPSFYWN